MNQIRILHNSYKSSHPPLVSVSSVHFMNQTERLLRKWREYFLDLKDMRLFLAIAEENNLTRAAQKNGYTQSAASHMLRNIETELGFSLFSRSQRGLALTRNGEALLSPIRRTLAAAEYFDQTAASIRGVQTGHIRIGAYLSASVQWLPPALKKFLSDYPDMTVEVLEGCSQEIEGWLENGSIDFGIVGPHPDGKMDWLPLKKEPYLAVCANDSPYAEYERFDLKDLPKVSYIEEKGETDLLRQFQQLGIAPPKPVFTSQNTYSMLAMVSHNLGVCILPELVVRDISKNVVRLPLNPPMERVLGVRIPSAKKASPAASLLIAQLQRTVFELEGPLL